MDIRRTILWMIFSFSLLLLWNNWQVHNGHPSLFGLTPPAATQADAPKGSDSAPAVGVPSVAPAQQPQAGESHVPAQATEPVGQVVTVKTDVYALSFDTIGAQLVGAELLKYKSLDGSGGPMMLLDRSAERTYLAQTGVVGAPQGQNYPTHLTPFSLVTPEPVVQGDTVSIAFETTLDHVKVIKTFTLNQGSYDIHVRHDIYNLGDAPIDPSLYLQLTRDGNDPPNTSHFYSTFTGPVVYSEQDKFQKVDFDDISKGKASYNPQADNGWIGMVQHYFASAWVPPQGVVRSNQALRVADNLYAVRTVQSVGTIAPGEHRTIDAQLWVGPQDQDAMSEVAPGLGLVVDYGWVTIIAKPLFSLMTWIHALLGNWGWTIVALTLLIKLVFYPLSAASYRSMAKMKLVTPRMQALREKFGDDKAKLNAAMMEMYRTEKINPLGGCLPMVVQVPVFIALYWVLLASVEMRGAPWILWIHDLSVRDPWFILPAIMMATMFLQIKLNPTPPDPTQAKIMMIMPLVFG
ncbi:MAG TPA: membrane protein insertase YidC, partial [Castellaniella sp.]|nr:membrane protein insertase YidC [Castellaniella sp.]